MTKITVKELPIGIKIKVTKKRLLSIPKLVYNKVKEFYHSSKNKLKNYVTAEDKNAELSKKIDDVKAKKSELYSTRRKMLKNEEFVTGSKKYYFDAIEEEIDKIINKEIKLKNKGLGVFSIGKLYINKFINNQKEKANKRKAKKELEKALKEQMKIEKELREKLEKLTNEKETLVSRTTETIKNNPKLEDYYKSIISDSKDNVSEKKIIPITATRKATEEEKAEIKKSNKFKKAIAAISAIVVASGIALGGFHAANTSGNIPSNQVSYTENIEEKINLNQENEIKLNDYIKLENGSKIFETSNFDGKSGEIGKNGYDNDTLFKINAISYTDDNNKTVIFNLVEQNNKKQEVQASHDEYIKNNPNAVMSAIHVTPCNNDGTPELEQELGGWTNTSNAQINKVELNNIEQQNLGGMTK